MNKREYAKYEQAVADFFESEGIENLSTGHHECPDCHEDWDDNDACPECEVSRTGFDEPSFSWRPCDCCQRNLGGDRYHATGYNREHDSIYEYDICVDCMYYAEYGRLDDTTMEEVERE